MEQSQEKFASKRKICNMASSEIEELERLQKQLQQKDETIALMKTKTKDFVAKMKEEHSQSLAALTASLENAKQVHGLVKYFISTCFVFDDSFFIFCYLSKKMDSRLH